MIEGWEAEKMGQLIKLEYGKSLKDYQDSEGPVQVFGTNGPIGFTHIALYEQPSLIIGRKGAYRGVHYSPGPLFVIDTAFYTRTLREGLSEKYLYYWFQTIDFDDMDSGSAIPSTSRDEVHDLDILLPQPEEQGAIAEVLASLDDKIDLLRRQNATLEALAETLFRQAFIEEAHDDWEEEPLDQVANYLNGLACQKYPPTNPVERLPVLKIKDLKNGLSDSSDWATSKVPPEYIVENGDIIFSWSASLLVKVWDGPKCVLNQHLFKVTSDRFPIGLSTSGPSIIWIDSSPLLKPKQQRWGTSNAPILPLRWSRFPISNLWLRRRKLSHRSIRRLSPTTGRSQL